MKYYPSDSLKMVSLFRPILISLVILSSGALGCERIGKLAQNENPSTGMHGSSKSDWYIEATYCYPFDRETRQSLSIDDLKRIGDKTEVNGVHPVISTIPSMVTRGKQATRAEITSLDLRFGMIYRGPDNEMQDLWIDRSCNYGISNGFFISVNPQVGELIRHYCKAY